MTEEQKPLDPISKAIKAAGSPTELARLVGVSPQNIFNWKRRGIPPEKVPAVVRASGGAVLAHELRPDLPDLFPAPNKAA
ncbi:MULTISPECIES: transcriptional regulator [Pseudomonas]|uniref:transcriptional regulator n=1 Tax=Pseudomonas nitroreducens TaxID=46680 RepID=UPI001E375265|nr:MULTISPECIES: YdaS family helix-turn-helix protein [Pseudomonas]MCE4070134.1 helix-turn-helix domain-containing protein [Pseudomonas nitritireducens]MCE4078739.1 helix-turn-helix domain-containing protein [Pseudomonas nitroreducens]